MKNNNILLNILFLAAFLSFASCYDDKGNYSYSEINQVTISFDEEIYEVGRYMELEITPNVTFSMNSDHEYEYLWVVQTGRALAQNDTISRERVLKTNINIKSGTYVLFLAVKDQNTGVSFRKDVALSVKTELSQGFLFACNNGGKLAIDMLARKSLIVDDVDNFRLIKNLELRQNLPPFSAPKSIRYSMVDVMDYMIDPWDPAYSDYINSIITDGAILHLNEDLEISTRTDIHINATIPFPTPFRPENNFNFADEEYVFANGDVYWRSSGVTEEYFVAPMNTATEAYAVYPDLLAFSLYGWNLHEKVLFYDVTNKRFVAQKSGDKFLSAFLPPASGPDFHNIGKEMEYMRGPAYNNNGYAVVRGVSTTDRDLYVFSGTNALTATATVYSLGTYPAMDQAKFFEVSSKYPYFYYATDTEVYQCNYDLGVSTVVRVFVADAGKKIARMKFNRFTPDNTYGAGVDKLLICVNSEGGGDSDCGELHIYTIQGANAAPVKFGTFSGIGRIVDVAFKEK